MSCFKIINSKDSFEKLTPDKCLHRTQFQNQEACHLLKREIICEMKRYSSIVFYFESKKRQKWHNFNLITTAARKLAFNLLCDVFFSAKLPFWYKWKLMFSCKKLRMATHVYAVKSFQRREFFVWICLQWSTLHLFFLLSVDDDSAVFPPWGWFLWWSMLQFSRWRT